jgi:hypothetical protein
MGASDGRCPRRFGYRDGPARFGAARSRRQACGPGPGQPLHLPPSARCQPEPRAFPRPVEELHREQDRVGRLLQKHTGFASHVTPNHSPRDSSSWPGDPRRRCGAGPEERDDLGLVHALVPGHGAYHRVQRTRADVRVIRYRDCLVSRGIGLKHGVAASLVDDSVGEVTNKHLREGATARIPRNSHARVSSSSRTMCSLIRRGVDES